MAFRILIHALRMLTGNLSVALRIAAPVFIADLAFNFYMGSEALIPPDFDARSDLLGPYLGKMALGGLLTGVFMLWTAVAWHRFILLEEAPQGPLAAPKLDCMGRYFVGLLVTVLLTMLIVVPVGLIGGIAVVILALTLDVGSESFIITTLPALVGAFIAAWFSLRLSPMLPSAAIGPRMGFDDAWHATRGTTGMLAILTLVLIMVGYGAGLIPQALAATALPLALFLGAVINTVFTMIGFSILTTIYGVTVEKRNLNA
ncbi:MAG: hypothetical protein R3D60_00825 [Paracoccaceae bacterium]